MIKGQPLEKIKDILSTNKATTTKEQKQESKQDSKQESKE